PGAAATITVGTQPSNTVAGSTITPAVTVTVKDANNNVIPGDSVSVDKEGGDANATLSGTTSRTTDLSGVATFDDLSINKTGSDYKLDFADGAATATSDPFAITPGDADHVVFTTQPSSSYASGGTISVAATIQDAFGNAV